MKGTFPSGLTLLPSLSVINVSSNQLTGSLPETMGISNQLQRLDLSDNYLTGNIPSQLCERKNLNLGATLRYGCDGILCPKGTFNSEFGYGFCSACEGNNLPYLGSKSCNIVPDELTIQNKKLDVLRSILSNTPGWTEEYDTSWSNENDKCSWIGVVCEEGKVVSLNFPAALRV